MHLPANLDVPALIHSFTEERRYLKGVSEATLDWYKYSFRGLLPFIEGAQNGPDLHLRLKRAMMDMAAAGMNPITINGPVH